MNKDGEINFQNFETLLKRQSEAGNGIVLLGSTGEGLALSRLERQSVVEFASKLDLDVPLMVGVNGHNMKDTIAWINFCNQYKNIDSYLMPVPLYAKPGARGQYEWFNQLLEASEKPCMLYNVPSRTGAKLSFSTAQELQSHPNFWALKEASGSIEDFKTFCTVLPEIEVYSGEDALVPLYCYYGCKGLVSVMSNVWPEETNLFVEKCLNFDLKGLYPTWDLAANSLFVASNPVPTKIILYAKNLIDSATLREPLTIHDMNNLDVVTKADQLVTQWYKVQQNKTQGEVHA